MARDRIRHFRDVIHLFSTRTRTCTVSKCPQCGRPTHGPKFALFVHIDKFVPLAMSKTLPLLRWLLVAHRTSG